MRDGVFLPGTCVRADSGCNRIGTGGELMPIAIELFLLGVACGLELTAAMRKK